MEFSDYFDIMDLIRKGEYKFTTREEQNFLKKNSRYGGWGSSSTNDNCFIPDPIDMTDLYLFDTFNLDTDETPKPSPKPSPKPKPKTLPKPKKVLKEIKHSPTKFDGWKKQNVKIVNICDIQNDQKNSPKKPINKRSRRSRRRNTKDTNKGKYVPPSLR